MLLARGSECRVLGVRISEFRASGFGFRVKGIRGEVHLLVRRALAASCCLDRICKMKGSVFAV